MNDRQEILATLGKATTPLTLNQIADQSGISYHKTSYTVRELQHDNRVGFTRDGKEVFFWIKGSKITARDLLTQKWDRSVQI